MPPTHRAYRVWQTSFAVASSDPRVLEQLDRLCHQFASTPALDATAISIEPATDGGFEVAVDRQPGGLRNTPRAAAQRVEWWMMRLASRAERQLTHLHGAVLVRAGRSVLIPGASGVGKSTFALALTAHGFDLLADDIAFADLHGAALHGLRRAPHIHDDAIPILRDAGFAYRPERHLPGFLEVEALDRWHRQPAPLPGLVLLVDWDDDGPTAHHPVTHAEAAIELRKCSYNLKRQPDGGWSAVASLLRDARCARLIRGPDLGAAASVVADLLAA